MQRLHITRAQCIVIIKQGDRQVPGVLADIGFQPEVEAKFCIIVQGTDMDVLMSRCKLGEFFQPCQIKVGFDHNDPVEILARLVGDGRISDGADG